jgi:hypothetical protein
VTPKELLKALADIGSPLCQILAALCLTFFVFGHGHDPTWAFMSISGTLSAIWLKLL